MESKIVLFGYRPSVGSFFALCYEALKHTRSTRLFGSRSLVTLYFVRCSLSFFSVALIYYKKNNFAHVYVITLIL